MTGMKRLDATGKSHSNGNGNGHNAETNPVAIPGQLMTAVNP
jgi:hypothetical protein